MIRSNIAELNKMGRFPSYKDNVDEKTVATYESLIKSVVTPVTDEEAAALCGLLGPDDFYGLAWSTLHLIETAPGWPSDSAIQKADVEWQDTLNQRIS